MTVMQTPATLKNLLLTLLLTLTASGVVSANLASGPQTLGPDLHQVAGGLEAAPRLGLNGSSYDAASESPVVTRGAREAKGFKGSKGFELKNHPSQPVRNAPTRIGDRDFSGHALDQMQNRGITPSVVENAVKTGNASPGNVAGRIIFRDSTNNISVVTDTATGRVITVRGGQ